MNLSCLGLIWTEVRDWMTKPGQTKDRDEPKAEIGHSKEMAETSRKGLDKNRENQSG